jgi:TonB family protein
MLRQWIQIAAVLMACACLATGAGAQEGKPQRIGNFRVLPDTDPITDESRGVAGAMDGEDGDVRIAWHCAGDDVNITLMMGVPGGSEDVLFVYRFDQDRPDTTIALGLPESGVRFRLLPSRLVYQFTQRARRAGRLVLREFDGRGRAMDHIISMAGSERALTQLPCVRRQRPTSPTSSLFRAVEGSRVPSSLDTLSSAEVERMDPDSIVVRPELANRSEVASALRRTTPPLLRDAGVGGSVLLEFTLGTNGSLSNPVVVSSENEQFSEAALRLATRMRFTPLRVGGAPRIVRWRYRVEFTP